MGNLLQTKFEDVLIVILLPYINFSTGRLQETDKRRFEIRVMQHTPNLEDMP
jgi:hypothetical protein